MVFAVIEEEVPSGGGPIDGGVTVADVLDPVVYVPVPRTVVDFLDEGVSVARVPKVLLVFVVE